MPLARLKVFQGDGPAVDSEYEILGWEAEPGLLFAIQDREIDSLSRSQALRNSGLAEGEQDGNNGR